ncbi:MAG: phosphocholine cytidylyltransferase family protein [Alphaproteobacteria bacterium]
MKAIILAAGVGRRLGEGADHPPKSLLAFGGRTLLARHIAILHHVGIESLVVATGYKADLVAAELASLGALADRGGFATCVLNPDYREGSIVSLWAVRHALACGDEVVLMDADVLYDHRLMERLVHSARTDCFLLDRDMEAGDEPVKLCIKGGRIVDFHKIVRDPFDYCGESVGFFRFSPAVAARLAAKTEAYVASNRRGEWYEEAVRDVLLESPPGTFGFEDVTGLPWIEIDFPEDVRRARDEILPRLTPP